MQVELNPLDVPTHASIKMPAGLRQDGFKAPPTMRLTDLPRDVVLALCNEMTAAVLATWDETATAEMIGQHVVQR